MVFKASILGGALELPRSLLKQYYQEYMHSWLLEGSNIDNVLVFVVISSLTFSPSKYNHIPQDLLQTKYLIAS